MAEDDIPTDPSLDQAPFDAAATELGQAQDSADWGQWQQASGDEWATSAESYAEAAANAYATGDTAFGDQLAADAQAQAGYAGDQYTEAGYSYDTAGSSTAEAQANVDYGSYGADAAPVDTSGYDAGYETAPVDTSAGYDTGSEL
jgi:hypothetical protein